MRLIVNHLNKSPVGSPVARRALGALDFTQRANAPLSACEIGHWIVSVDEESFLTIEATYTPVNKVLSLLAGFTSSTEEINVFSTTAEFDSVPTYFCVRLPTGGYVELRLDRT